ncbi:DUF7219 family protein [Thermosynechococcus vestitus]|uniref:Tsl0785 protein n=1 Tax=Thermosynechococcus vestitus (strain NIES-2133 / IAM M-273 / BP-1) TaxID=197221 RepID=Q8DKS2_THEVB|nr:hypothetical protein [Thermosynechococcus vestitus]BAC08336.1 tsl0785 [Thermosynechococcus vestitus BP-1]BAY52150.1 hypothetical protein NIES2134_102470 [Thermostichus vulcanus NIES-2134]
MNKYEFLHPHHRYYGEFTPENFLFDANLQEFATRVSYIASLENSGKLSPQDAYKQIKNLWKELKASKKSLLDTPPSS